MFTWNLQYISKARLAEALSQLTLDPTKGDILIRIHTAIHFGEEAVELARFIANLVPRAHIFGTSTSSAICWGKLLQNQCVISVTQMSEGCIRTDLLPTFNDRDIPIAPDILCERIRDSVTDSDTKLILAFLTVKYLDVYTFVDKSNIFMPNISMIGGIADYSKLTMNKCHDSGFVFNENGWTDKGIIVASISGKNVESYSSCATGAQAIGNDIEITDTFGTCILSLDGKDAAENFLIGMVLEDIFADFSKELISNVMNAIPENRNIRLVVLPGRYYNPGLPYDDVCTYNEVYNNVFKLGEQCNFDGFIVHIGNLSNKKKNTIDESFMANFKKVPNVFIATDIENVTTVSYDNESGIREAIDYLVNINGLSRICMLGGRSDNVDSVLRKEIFIRFLENNGIKFTEDNFINTDFRDNVEDAPFPEKTLSEC